MQNRVTQKKHILLVDDEKNLTQMLSMLLETRGYDVQVANNATEAFQKINPDYDLIILDLVLPDLSGFEVCRRLKQKNQTRHIPIIMLSAHCLYEDKVEGLYLGADDFLSKPCEHEELFARMEAVMRRGRLYANAHQSHRDEDYIYELRRILDHGLMVPYYQPIYLFQPFQFFGIEVLARPISKGELANPEKFFKVALQYGLYMELEMLSWSIALSQISKIIKDEKIFLNCNPYFVESSQFIRVRAIFEKNHIPTQNVILEITERSEIKNFRLFYDQLQLYRNYGFRFAVDDVGGGYASLESIVETKPEVVKIDHHIIREIEKDSYKQSVVRFIASFCKENNIISIAEGIETQEEFITVCRLGVNAGQGFFLFKPTSNLSLEKFNNVTP